VGLGGGGAKYKSSPLPLLEGAGAINETYSFLSFMSSPHHLFVRFE
jgi:hypothetical protein